MEDRVVTVTHEEGLAVWDARTQFTEVVRLTGTDAATGETVKFKIGAGAFGELIHGLQFRNCVDVRVRSEHILSVTSEPDWDSPGTSPEEEGA